MDPSLRGWRGGGRWPGGGPGDWPSCLGLAVARSSSGTLTNCRDLSGLGNVRASNTSHVKLFTCRLGINQLDILPQKNHKRALIEIIIKGEPSSFPYHCGSVKCYQWWIFRIGNWSNEMWERGRCLVLVVSCNVSSVPALSCPDTAVTVSVSEGEHLLYITVRHLQHSWCHTLSGTGELVFSQN